MNESANYLSRRYTESEYNELRAFMLEKVQLLSGHLWTDYNLHDPGVTILEQLSYALTDINYRSNYSVEDILVDKDNSINLHQHALFMPDEALPCRPVTIIDYQKYLLDQIDDLAYVMLTPTKLNPKSNDSSFCGCLYDVYIKQKDESFFQLVNPNTSINLQNQENIKKKLTKVFNQVRNIGEDINQIYFIDVEPTELIASIEVDDSRTAVEILCNIYYEMAKILSGMIHKQKYDNENIELAESLTGPWLKHGFLDDHELDKFSQSIPLSAVVSQLKKIPGLIKVRNIALKTQKEEFLYDFLPPLKTRNHQLVIPAENESIKVELKSKDKPLDIDFNEFSSAYEMLLHKNHHQNYFTLKPTEVTLEHETQQLNAYTSIQTQFPNLYGINQYGVPASYSTEKKAQALQLKGYLMLFDQVMSDHLAILDNVKNLFSLDLDTQSSYKTQALKKDSIPDIEKLYIDIPNEEYLTKNKNYEAYFDRKSRVFDYLLAMNGRDKEQYGFEYKNPYFTQEEQAKKILKDKQRNIVQVHDISANRSAGYDCTIPSWGKDNVSSLEKYIANVLGVDPKCRSFVYPLIKLGLRLDSEDKENKNLYFVKDKTMESYLDSVDLSFRDIKESDIPAKQDSFTRIPTLSISAKDSKSIFHSIFLSLVEKNTSMAYKLLKNGVDLGLYRVTKDKQSYELLYNIEKNPNKEAEWQYIASFSSLKKSFLAANQLRNNIVEINLEMEGLHLIEHGLLAPVDKTGNKQIKEIAGDDFYSYQISIILPNWSLRFNDYGFQKYTEKLIRNECPAHIYINIHWLDFSNMEKFEVLFKAWLNCKNKSGHNMTNLISKQLESFLKSLVKQ